MDASLEQEGIASIAWTCEATALDERGDPWLLSMQCGPSNNVQRAEQAPSLEPYLTLTLTFTLNLALNFTPTLILPSTPLQTRNRNLNPSFTALNVTLTVILTHP